MSDDLSYSYVQNIPIVSSLFKEALYEQLVHLGVDPSNGDLLPDPHFMEVNTHLVGTGEPLCEACVVQVASSIGDDDAHVYYHNRSGYIYDTPLSCEVCDRKLRTEMTARGSQAIIRWTSRHAKQDYELSTDDWLDLWMAANALDHDDILWDHIGYVLTKCTDFYVAKDGDIQ